MRPARFILRCLSFFLVFALLLPSLSSLASAQAPQPEAGRPLGESQTPHAVSSYAQPNFEPGVPLNMHTFVQGIFLEMMLALGCQLSGIDLASPGMPCLAPNPFTSKIGYAPGPVEGGELQIGGLLGVVGRGIGTMYTPTVTTSDYTRYLANSFGLVKQTLAAPPRDAFEGFSPLLGLWTASRNIAYFLLILAFVFIGIGVMMRIQLDPRTVMTIQNQIPRVIIAIILITFSYSIAAIMADLMWASTYLMINVVQNATGTKVKECGNVEIPISTYATNTILASPFSFVNRVFLVDDCDRLETGMFDLSRNVSNNITGLEKDIVMSIFGLDPDATCSWNQGSNESGGAPWYTFIPGVTQAITIGGAIGSVISGNGLDIGDCIFYGPFGKVMDWFVSTAWQIAVFIALVITLGRIWFMLLKAYAHIFLYVILAPIFIVVNLLPKRPLGIERWLRVFFVNLAIFPVTVLMLLLARAFMDMFDHGADKIFVPPLVGNPNHDEFGALIGFSVLLIIPGMYSLLRDKFSLQDIKQTAIGGQTFGSAGGAAAFPAKKFIKGQFQKDAAGNRIGYLGYQFQNLGTRMMRASRVPILKNAADLAEFRRRNYGHAPPRGRRPGDWKEGLDHEGGKPGIYGFIDMVKEAKAREAAGDSIARTWLGKYRSPGRGNLEYDGERWDLAKFARAREAALRSTTAPDPSLPPLPVPPTGVAGTGVPVSPPVTPPRAGTPPATPTAPPARRGPRGVPPGGAGRPGGGTTT